MLRSTGVAIALAAICAFAISMAGSAVAATPAPNGSLTATEYKQMTAELAALKKFDHNKRATWQEGYAACDKVGQSTALLHSVRTNCNTVLLLDQALVGFYTQAAKCSALSTTTTGTTTTTTPTQTTTTGTTTTGTTPSGTTTTPGGLTSTELQFIACLRTDYQAISLGAQAVYKVQVALRHQVVARHFAGRCLLTLAPRRSDLKVLKRFAATSKQLAADVTKISKVQAGTLPASAINTSQINKDSKAFTSAGDAISKTSRPQKLSVCPHATS